MSGPVHKNRDNPGDTARPPQPNDAPFFIVGPPRSGTTLVQAMLASHPRLTIPPETELYLRLPAKPSPADITRYEGTEAFREQRTPPQLLRGVGERAEVLRRLLAAHGERAGKPRVGEKSPHHLRHTGEIAADFPGAKFISVLRDPRDVIASRLRTPWTDASHLGLAKSWKRDFRRHQRLLQTHAGRAIALRFEDLIDNPEAELRRLCDFLGEAFDPAMLNYHQRQDAGFAAREQDWKRGTLEPIDPNAKARYLHRLNARQIAGIQRVLGPVLCEAGYEPHTVAWKPSFQVRDAVDLAFDRAKRIRKSVRKRMPEQQGERDEPDDAANS